MEQVAQRFRLALDRSPLSAREIAAEMTRRGRKVSHTKVNGWKDGRMPRLDDAALLAEVADLDIPWIMFGEGPPPWELTERQRRILWLAEVVGLDKAAARLAKAPEEDDEDGSFAAAPPPSPPDPETHERPA